MKKVIVAVSVVVLLALTFAGTTDAQKGGFIKPQFELRREDVRSGGVVRDPALHERAVEKVRAFVKTMPLLKWSAFIASPILGGEGNKEFLAHLCSASA